MKSKRKENFAEHHFQNILRLVDVLSNFTSTTCETIDDYYL